MTIELPPEVETRLKAEAERKGLDPSALATRLIVEALPVPEPTAPTNRGRATIDLLDQWEAQDATDDPEEIARRQQEFEEFKAAMNRNRLEMEGPNARIPFP